LPGILSAPDDRHVRAEHAIASSQRTEPRVWPAPAIVAILYLLFIIPHLRRFGALWFVRFGSRFLTGASTSHLISPALGASQPIGYDGQFYFSVAIDPKHATDYISAMGTAPGVVYSRALYPALGRLLGGSTPTGVASALLAINLVSVIAGTFFVAAWLRNRKVNPGYALIYGFFPGMIFSVLRDLTEPLAYALVAAAIYFFDRPGRRAYLTAIALLALAMLTRETTAVFPALMAISLVASDWREQREMRAFLRGGIFLTACIAPLLAWRLFISLWLGSGTQEHPGGGFAYLVPFDSYISSWPWQRLVTFVFIGVVVPTIVSAIAVTIAALRTRQFGLPLALFAVNAVIFVAYVPKPLLVDYNAATRAATGLVLSLALCIPLFRRRQFMPSMLAVIWSPAWYIGALLVVRHAAPPFW